MAKKSMIAREVKRIKTVAKFAEKRIKLKKAMYDMDLSSEERYEARVKFQAIAEKCKSLKSSKKMSSHRKTSCSL